MGLLNPHLDDDDFADVWTARAALGVPESDRPAEGHLRRCPDCRTRYGSFASWLDGLRVDAQLEAEELVSRERLAAQQTQIFRRLEALEHPARVIAFPRFTSPVASRAGGPRRWVAAAAAVGLITGVGLGRLFDYPTGRPSPDRYVERPVARAVTPTIELQPASHINDEAFVSGPEVTVSQVLVPDSLQYLNAITPSARD